MKKRSSIPCLFNSSTVDKNSSLIPVKITLLHSNENRNQSNIEQDVIVASAESIKNKPILAYITKDEDGNYDFTGHEIELKYDEETGEPIFRYLEFPVGIIPESTEIGYFSKDGKVYMTCTGYIYREYSNETLAILKETNGKCVSVELEIIDGDINDDGYFDIKAFEFLGVTILSDKITPGMDENCRISFMKDTANERFVVDYSEFLEKANKDVLNFETENVDEETNEDNENEPETDNDDIVPNGDEDKPKSNEEPVDEPTDEPIKEIDFSLFNEMFEKEITSMEELLACFVDILNPLQEELKTLKEFKENYDKEKIVTDVDDMLEKFNLDEEEISGLREKAYNSEITIDELETQLYVLVGKKSLKKFTKTNEHKTKKIKIINKDKKSSNSPYGGLLDDFFNEA